MILPLNWLVLIVKGVIEFTVKAAAKTLEPRTGVGLKFVAVKTTLFKFWPKAPICTKL